MTYTPNPTNLGNAYTLQTLYEYIRYIGGKDISSSEFIKEFNLMLPIAVMEIYNEEYDKYLAKSGVSDVLNPYVRTLDGKFYPMAYPDKNGLIILPEDFLHHKDVSRPYIVSYTNGEPNIRWRPVEILTENQLSTRQDSRLLKIDDKHPVGVYRGGNLQVYPIMKEVKLTYFLKPEQTHLSYYINSLLEIVYMSENATHKLTGTETGENGEVAPATVTSLTEETMLPDSAYPRLAYNVASKLGINIKDVTFVQYSEAKGQKENR